MTTIATIGMLAAGSWNITIGGGWIALMLIGMGLCFVFMLGFMWLMRDGRGWAMCGRRWQQATPATDIPAGAYGPTPDRTVSRESEVQR
jgi:hypothetical protein